MSLLPFATACEPSARDAYWEHCRNSLGIARLLVHEGRPRALVLTSCLMAVESDGRDPRDQSVRRVDGTLRRALTRLAAPRDLWGGAAEEDSAAQILAGAEATIAWM